MSKTQIFVLASAILLLAVVLDLVRRRRLKEIYSWIWLAAALFYLVMAVKPNIIKIFTDIVGITSIMTAFIFFGLFFIVLILIHYSVSLSKLTTEMKDIAQQIAILDGEHNKIIQFIEDKTNETSQDVVDQPPEKENDSFQHFEAGRYESGEQSQSLD